MTFRLVNLDEVRRGLARIRRRRRLLWSLWAAGVPAMLLVGYMFDSSIGSGIAALWFAAYVVSAIRVTTSRCPQCRNFYHGGFFTQRSIFTQRCQHCGLELRG